MELHDKLKALRKTHELTQTQVAKICFVSRQTVARWENGDAKLVYIVCKSYLLFTK